MKIAVVSRSEKHLLEIARLLRERSAADEVGVVSGSLERFSSGAVAAMPDLLLLDQPLGPDLARLERLVAAHPRMTAVVLSSMQTVEFMMEAMRAGVREVLPAPVSAASLLPAVARVADKLNLHEQANGKVFAFVSCKGGSGATFLATNLAYTLAALPGKKVALIDLNLQFGDASLFLADQKPLATLADVSLQMHRLDASLLGASMMTITPTLSVLAAPDDPVHAGDVRPEHVDTLLSLARRQFDFVVLDVARTLDPVGLRGLDLADTIFPVLQTTLPYVRDGKRLLEVFRSLGYPAEKVKVIVNRHQKKAQIGLQHLETACGAPVWRLVPNHYETAAASVNQGVPILKLAKKSPIAKALDELAHVLAGDDAAVKESWLSRLLKKTKRTAPEAVHAAPAVVAPAATAKEPVFEEKQAWIPKS
ncbi:AAA family ATPase [Massilia sp. LjRoot122]|uniref:AAA family ATPase n=1 Tax=Massilia sp. LjRoot122 TaxID=3342257 RepID=UPI003ECE3A7F